MSNFLGILQSEWAGAQAFSSFDTYLAPLVFNDNMTFGQVKKALRRFVYNLNVRLDGDRVHLRIAVNCLQVVGYHRLIPVPRATDRRNRVREIGHAAWSYRNESKSLRFG